MIKFSIRTKLLFSITIIALSVIGALLYSTFELVKNDKEAYIFESALKQTDLLSDDFSSFIKVRADLSVAFVSLYQNKENEKIENLAKRLNIVGIYFYKDSWETIYEGKDKSATPILSTDLGKKLSFEIIDSKNITAQISISLNNTKIVLLTKLSTLVDRFMAGTTFQNLLMDLKTGKSLLTGGEYSQIHKKIVEASSVHGVQKVVVGESSYLTSYQKLKEYNFVIVSFVDEKVAFSVIFSIVRKILFIAIFTLGLSLLFGVFVSKQLALPIINLTKLTEEYKKGNYEVKSHVKTRDEIKVLSESFNSLGEQINELLGQKEEMIHKLEDYGKNLENMVQERTLELSNANKFIKAMLDSLDQGLFVIDRNGNIGDIHTKSCQKIFGSMFESKDFFKLFLDKTDSVSDWLEVIFDQKIPLDSAIEIGPENTIVQKSSENTYVDFGYCPMFYEEGGVSNLLVIATDVTEKRNSMIAFEERKSYVDMVQKILTNKVSFTLFLDDAVNTLKYIDSLLALEDAPRETIVMEYHNLTGGFGLYHALSMKNHARILEDKIVDRSVPIEDLIEYHQEFKKSFSLFAASLEDVIGDYKNTYQVLKDDLLKLRKEIVIESTARVVNLFDNQFFKVEFSSLFENFKDLVGKISSDLNKPMKPLTIISDSILVDPNKYSKLLSSLVHVFRNSMDHGIESQEKRTALGKDIEGLISIDISLIDQKNIKIVIKDDGRGINVDKVKEKAIEKGIINKSDPVNKNQILTFIFMKELSTKESVSKFSGRGVGMSAVKDAIAFMGGKMKIDSYEDAGAVFEFIVPRY